MPRAARITFPNAFYHVFNRGVAKQKIFLDMEDYEQFLQFMHELKTKYLYDHVIYTYVLMPNHFHFLIQTRKTPLATLMKSLIIRYVLYFNRKYDRVGIMFQNRFKSKLCQKETYFLGASRYIHLNPLVAGLVNNINAYPWSSYQELFGESEREIIDRQEATRLIGDTTKEHELYKQFILDGLKKYSQWENEYSFDREIGGSALFNSLTQKKFLRKQRL